MRGCKVEKGVVVAASGLVAASGVIETLVERRFADMGARAKGSILHLPAPLVNKDLTFRPIDATVARVE